MHLLEETVLYNSMNKNHYYKERTEIWLARLHIKRFSILREKGCPSRHCKRNRIKQADSLEILHHVRKCSRHLEKVSYRTKIFKPYQFNILNVYKVNNFHRVEKSVLYDYLEEKSGFLDHPLLVKLIYR